MNRILSRLALTLAMTLVLAPAAHAADPIVTDRPDIAESSQTVGAGVFQYEQGVNVEAGSPGPFTFPALARLGIGEGFELRLETPIVAVTGGQAAFQELAVGAKWHFMDGGEWGQVPSMALLGAVTFDAAGKAEPELKLAADTALPGEFDLGLNIGTSLAPGSATPALDYAASLSHGLTDSLRAYLEGSGGRHFGANTSEFGVDGGLAYLWDANTQLDVSAYKGLTSDSTAWYAGIGLSHRWGR